METIKVLLFAANPRGSAPLDLSREFREIDEEVRRGAFRDAVELILVPGTRPVDLLRKLNESRPQVVHFSSHGGPDELMLESGDEEIGGPGLAGPNLRSLEDRDMTHLRPGSADSSGTTQGQPHGVSKSALANVLRSCDEGNLRLVVLNACETRSQAEALTEVVDCVVSMNRVISDWAAIKFAASFYGALAFGRSVQKAFDQGVARLSAEGIAEADTPELVMRAGVDASRVVLVGPKPGTLAPSTAESPFIVPFPRNADFVGRQGDLARLHASLWAANSGPVGIRPAGLTGMGGIGKTQLAVEYVHRHKDDYPDGIFWIDAASPLAEGFARLATDHRLRWADNDRPRDEQIRATFSELNRRPQSMLVLDNLANPAALAIPILPDCVTEHLRCRLLFTTRRHDLGRFAGVEVTILPEEPALRLLLRHESRQSALDSSHPDHEHARAIARMLGRLPLALELAGAYVGKFSGDVSLESYREGLRSVGALAMLDADAAELTEADLRRAHDPAVAATIGEQWAALEDESSRLLLRVASLFPESSAVPIARLGLLAGLSDEAMPGRPSLLRRAVKQLDDGSLLERLEGDHVRLHPLIREFASGATSRDEVDAFLQGCLDRASTSFEHFPTLEAQNLRRGIDALQEDLIAILELCPPSASDLHARLQSLLGLLQREAHNLRVNDEGSGRTPFAQQVRNRALLLGIRALQFTAEKRLTALARPHFRLCWMASRESPSLIRTLTGHRDWVSGVAVSPDGRHALSGSEDRTLKIWDLRTGQLLRSLAGHQAGINAVAMSPDKRWALSASGDRTLKLWEVESGRILHTFGGHAYGVTSAAISFDGRHAISGSLDRTLRCWDLRTGGLLHTFVGHEDGVAAVAITADGRKVCSGSRDRTVKVWDLQTGRLLLTFAGHEEMVCAVALSPDGRRALSGSNDRTVKVWDLETGQLLRTFAGHKDGVTAVAISHDGRRALSGSFDRTLRFWDLQTGELLRTFAGHEHGVSSVGISCDARYALSGSDDCTIKLWDLVTRQSPPISTGHEGPVIAVAVSLDRRRALSGSEDRTLKLWDVETGRLLHSLAGHESGVSAVTISPDGHHAISGSYDRTLRLWDLQRGELKRTFAGRKRGKGMPEVSPLTRNTLFGSLDDALKLWDRRKRHELMTRHRALRLTALRVLQRWILSLSRSHSINAVATTSNGRCALAGTNDNSLELWDLRTDSLIRSLVGHTGTVHAVATTPDNRRALSGSADRTLLLWDVATGRILHSFTGHLGPVVVVAISPDGRRAISGSTDRTLRLWDLDERVCQAMVPLESSPVALAVAPDGRTVVVGDRVGNVHLFEIHVS